MYTSLYLIILQLLVYIYMVTCLTAWNMGNFKIASVTFDIPSLIPRSTR